ncbi:hypothetical protein [Nitrococcus mobilis]|uniref:hypothetical protein n=1 Tax=Nitrococcus mobilis TaxID=35797 RepID=UPI0002F65247|nr:hypothetical protein [Nitrococcus mobilis]
MSELSKISSDHRHRRAVVYVRQSSTTQVEHNRVSAVNVIDGDSVCGDQVW